MFGSIELTLCDMQGKLFEMSAKEGYASESFIKAFMTSDTAADLDKPFNHMQWAGEGYIISRLQEEMHQVRVGLYMIMKPFTGQDIFIAIGISIHTS